MAVSKITQSMNKTKAWVIVLLLVIVVAIAFFVPNDGNYISFTDSDGNTYSVDKGAVEIGDEKYSIKDNTLVDSEGNVYQIVDGKVTIGMDEFSADKHKFFATFWALVPATIAIILALITKEVYSSLFIGILLGAIFYANYDGVKILETVVDAGFIASLSDSSHVGILIFLVILGVIGVLIFKSGATKAYGEWALRHIKSRRGAELATWVLGALIFVDDYFNCLTVGSVMRPLTDKFKVSRAKLAYIIDSTAAPICIIAPISSWAAAVATYLDASQIGSDPMQAFIECIPYNFYALLTITMIITIAVIGVEFGPMKKHEKNALKGDLFTSGTPISDGSENMKFNEHGKVIDLIIPVVVLIIVSILCLIYTGGFFDESSQYHYDFVGAFSNCSASQGLAYSSIITLLIAIVYYVLRKSADFEYIMDSMPAGFKNMVPPILILTFAWTICNMTNLLGASTFFTYSLAGAGALQNFLPAIFMLLACFIAFATGTSWGTMGIMLPIVTSVFSATSGEHSLIIVGIAAVMAGAVFGDHVSPISDTTIMSSAGAQCDHINHVSTQTPYAMLVAGISFVFYLIAGFWQSYIVTVIAIVAMIAVLIGIKMMQKKNGTYIDFRNSEQTVDEKVAE